MSNEKSLQKLEQVVDLLTSTAASLNKEASLLSSKSASIPSDPKTNAQLALYINVRKSGYLSALGEI